MTSSIINLPGGFSYTYVAIPLSSDVTITIEPPTGNTTTYYYFFSTEEQKKNPTLLPMNFVPQHGTGKTIVTKTTGFIKYYLTFTSTEPLENIHILIQSKKDSVFYITYALIVIILIIGIWFLVKKFKK